MRSALLRIKGAIAVAMMKQTVIITGQRGAGALEPVSHHGCALAIAWVRQARCWARCMPG
ncbi:hypothetical protein [Pseudomonas moraviensis]|uniref:hypothetical protein n=1 Tax=Pseudomonas moraviensis TaxID=321662 RepID=UPI0009376A03|nr:hypothetical protein [Pseudomonas moraviensis]OJT52948.1 hypothetical protein BSZ28_05820 [Pseudomonas moraviensis]